MISQSKALPQKDLYFHPIHNILCTTSLRAKRGNLAIIHEIVLFYYQWIILKNICMTTYYNILNILVKFLHYSWEL